MPTLALGPAWRRLRERHDAPVARRLYERARDAGVKHAYAATHRYDPSVEWLEELVRNGAIGRVAEVEGTFRRHVNPLTPWTWYDSVALGGGLLHNSLPHWLGILQRVLGGELLAAVGETRRVRERAPVVPDIHDFRLRGARRPSPAEAERLDRHPHVKRLARSTWCDRRYGRSPAAQSKTFS